MPFDVTPLTQEGNLIEISDTDTQERGSSQWGSNPGLGLEGSDLEDYLADLAACQAIDAAAGLIPPISDSDSASSDYHNSYVGSSSVVQFARLLM